MGALHEGHLSLVRMAKEKADSVVVSIFVNPTQFSPGEDFERYPRMEKIDAQKLEAVGVDMLYVPSVTDIYPEGPARHTSATRYADILCGARRPGHFDGVATVVRRLLELVRPDIAIFGEKDYQQLMVIRALAKEFNLKVDIVSAPIFRESDGLAMSSRNAYLSVDERAAAPLIHQTLAAIAEGLRKGGNAAALCTQGFGELEQAGFKVDYLEVRDSADLSLITGKVKVPARVFAAAFLGITRLIDNVIV
jgi:pantoate--beta-alanine ligase